MTFGSFECYSVALSPAVLFPTLVPVLIKLVLPTQSPIDLSFLLSFI